MKKSSLIVMALVALTSCSTVKTGDGSVSRLPKNTVVIRNRTQYHLEIFRNGVAWEIPAKFNGRTIQVPAIVSPHREVILYDATSFERENVYLGVNAIKSERMGCLEAFKIVRKHHFRINLGTNSQPVLVTIR